MKRESTQRVQTSAKDYAVFCNVKVEHNIETRLIIKLTGNLVMTPN